MPPHLHAKTLLAVLAVCVIYIAQLICLVGAGSQGQTIAAHFHGVDNVVWFSAPITTITVVLGPIVSQAADYWGRKWFLVVLTFIGAVGAVIVARASTMNEAIAGFCVLGISFGVQPLLHTVISEVLPRRWRSYGQAAAMGSNGVGSILGLLSGGALNRDNDPASDGFRYYFYMCMAFYVTAAVLVLAVYSPPETPKQIEYRGRNLDKLKKLDWVGYFFLAAGLVLFSLGLSYYQNPYPWSDPHVSATFAVGLALALCLVGYETFVKKDGMFHHGLFNGNRNYSIALVCVFGEGVAFFAANIYFAFQISVLYERDALLVGVRYSVMLLCSIVSALAAGIYCAVTRKVRWITVLAFAIFVAFFSAMATTDRTTDAPTWGYPVLLGTALGMVLTTLITVAQLSTPPPLIAVASGLIISVRSLGGTAGIAIYNALFHAEMSKLKANVAEAVLPLGLPLQDLAYFTNGLAVRDHTALREALPGITPEVIGAGEGAFLDTYALSFRYVWICATCFVAVAGVLAAFLYDPEKEFNGNVDAPMFSTHDDAPMEVKDEMYSSS